VWTPIEGGDAEGMERLEEDHEAASDPNNTAEIASLMFIGSRSQTTEKEALKTHYSRKRRGHAYSRNDVFPGREKFRYYGPEPLRGLSAHGRETSPQISIRSRDRRAN
jgi:hypothetical protein